LVKLQAVTAEQIQEAFRKVVTDQNRLVISVAPEAAEPEEKK
jgi:predicted Zn-dependent peptidase